MDGIRRWWDNPRIPLTSKWKLRIAWISIWASLIFWPPAMLLLDEPPVILSLSFLAITYTAWDIVSTSDSGAELEDH